MQKLTKLISGKMNVPYIVCKPGYAIGSNKPKRVAQKETKALVTKLRVNEKLVA